MDRLSAIAATVERLRDDLPPVAVGGIVSGVAADQLRVVGLANHAVRGERVRFGHPRTGPAGEIVRLETDGAIVRPLDGGLDLPLGSAAFLAGPLLLSPGRGWLGRVVDGAGDPIDGGPPLPQAGTPRPIEDRAPEALARPLPEGAIHTGIRVVDLFTPIVHGQRIGVFAGSGVGKSTFLSMLGRTEGFDAAVVALVGERGREVRSFLQSGLAGGRSRTVVVVATADESAVKRRLAPLTAITIAEALAAAGSKVLLVVDSLTRYAHALRDVALGAGEPPVARGYPPSVFGTLSRFLERAGMVGSGSVTAVLSVLLDGDDANDPVADAARGILDGHILLDRRIAEAGRYPAVDIARSISRLADQVWTAEQRQLVARLRAMIHLYEDTRDLRILAGDAARRDGETEQAAAIVPRLYKALVQSPDDPPSRDPYDELARLLRQSSG